MRIQLAESWQNLCEILTKLLIQLFRCFRQSSVDPFLNPAADTISEKDLLIGILV